MATLTGAARVAVGPDLAPFYATEQNDAAALSAAAMAAADPVWQMPYWEPYEKMIEPGIADLDNAPAGGMAGSITAALFLRRFCDGHAALHAFRYLWLEPEPGTGATPRGAWGRGRGRFWPLCQRCWSYERSPVDPRQ